MTNQLTGSLLLSGSNIDHELFISKFSFVDFFKPKTRYLIVNYQRNCPIFALMENHIDMSVEIGLLKNGSLNQIGSL